jgi:DNA replication protein DnaC
MAFVHFPRRLKEEMGAGELPPDFEPGINYLLTGGTKRGKSLTAAHWVKGLLESQELSARWVPADDYVEWIKDSFNNDGEMGIEYSNPYLIKYVKAVYDVVVLDGLGEERQTDFARHELGSLIRKRYDDMRTTIITSRLPVRDILDTYGERVSSALDSYDVVIL